MAAPDMEVIKEIPGYKVILKAVLKSQIQQLVEQLARSTDEESVILTASVADGTLCHLGSDSGKVFLEDHEDIKSQFLGFCLKRHHKQKQDKERQEALEKEEALARSMAPTTPPRYGGMGPRAGFMQQRSPRYTSPHPMSLSRASPHSNIRSSGPGVRHHPYQMTRPPRPRLSLDQQTWSGGQAPPPMKIPDGQVIKIEPDDDNDNEDSDKVQTPTATDTSQPSSPSVKPTTPGGADNDDAKSESSTSTSEQLDTKLSESIPAVGLSLDSDLSNLMKASSSELDASVSQSADDSNNISQSSVRLDPNIGVKLEAVTDAEMDLEITGVELGQRPTQEPMSSQNWMPNISMQGASGSATDMGGYNMSATGEDLPYTASQYYPQSQPLHTASQNYPQSQPPHTASQFYPQSQPPHSPSDEGGDNKWQCSICGKYFSSKGTLRVHERAHTGKMFSCKQCGKCLFSKQALVIHERTHTGEKPFTCDICHKGFTHKGNLKSHYVVHVKY